MTIIYLHGLDSSPDAAKALITATHAQALGMQVLRPNLNCPPEQSLATIGELIEQYPDAVLVGSSLGGYFANVVSDLTGVPAVLLNPNIRPDLSFRRFLADHFGMAADVSDADRQLMANTVIYTTTGGWQIEYGDLAWFEAHRLQVVHPSRLKVLLKLGDELLDAHASQAFYQAYGVEVLAQAGGDHSMSDYADNVAQVLSWIAQLKSTHLG